MATRSTALRWVTAAAVTGAVVAAPTALARSTAGGGVTDPAGLRALVAAARASTDVPHQGLVEATGTLGLPDLPRLGDVAALLGSSTTARVWWRSPSAWRVDKITATGESDTYAVDGGVQTWDFETGQSQRLVDLGSIRLPRVDDLVPPQAARRALAGVTRRDALTPLPPRRVAGRAATGVRIVPADARSTIGRIDVYVDERTDLPLSLVVVPRSSTVAALRSTFVDVSFTAPAVSDTTPRTPPFGRVRTSRTPDLASASDRYAPFALPDRLAGMPRGRGLLAGQGTATYGRGLARFVVVPLQGHTGRAALTAATSGGGAALDVGVNGEAVLVTTPLLNVVVARAEPAGGGRSRQERWYLVSGMVDAATLQAAVRGLADNPPGFR